MSASIPVATLVILGALVAILGLFVAGNIVMVGVGLVAVFGALTVLGILLVLIAITFGLMLAPLALGIIVLVVVVRRADGALNAPTVRA